MTYINIEIRNADQLKQMNTALKDALLTYSTNKCPVTEIPLMYQYLHNPSVVVTDEDIIANTIGKVCNLRYDKSTSAIMGDITTYNIAKLSPVDPTVVDNIIANFNTKTQKIEIKAFVVYNMNAKRAVIDKKLRGNRNTEIPLVVSQNVTTEMSLQHEELMEKFRKEFKTLAAKENIVEGMKNE